MHIQRTVVTLAAAIALVFTLAERNALADWIWRPDVGWINSREIVKASPEEQFAYASKLAEDGSYKEAASAYRMLINNYPDSPLVGKSAFEGGRCMYLAGYYYTAFLGVKKAVRSYADSIDLGEAVKLLYDIGLKFLAGAKREFMGVHIFSGKSSAVEVFEEIVALDPWGEWGDDARLGIGDAHFQMKEYDPAIKGYQDLIDLYPDSPLVGRARLQQAKCYDIKSHGWSYDQLSLSKAVEVLREIRPDADVAEQAEALKEVIEDRLARKYFEIGKFYLRRDKPLSAELYFLKVIRELPNTVWAEKAKSEVESLAPKLENVRPKAEPPSSTKEEPDTKTP
ncbi:MAG: outer membrane protein assembly factor BamD [Candidatus Brocadiia bacterium]